MRSIFALMCFAVLAGCLAPVTLAQTTDDDPKDVVREDAAPQKWALLIGIEKYHRVSRLKYTINDVEQIAASLEHRGDYHEENILTIVDTASNPRFQPLRASLMAELPRFLKQPGPEDHILVYFSGHGMRDDDGKLYLAPIDIDAEDPEGTGVSVAWFREQLAGCRAKVKLLVLDACHAGSEKGGDATKSVAAKDLGAPFRDVAGVVTLASSTSDEVSQIWEEKEQSLFSYWLNQGLKGHADRDGDAAVTIDELYGYVYRNVTHSAKKLFPRAQTPVRIVRSGTPGVPEVVHLRPQQFKQVLSDMAEELSWAMQERELEKVGVLEFTNDTQLGELLGADFGLLGRYCAEELARQLIELGDDEFGVVDRRRLQVAIRDHGFTLDDLGRPDALAELSQRAGGMPVIALGTLRNRAGRVVTLQCKLIHTENDRLAGAAGGTAVLNESQWAMLGRSVRVRPEDRRPPPPMEGVQARPVEEQVIERLDQRAEAPHPLADPKFPLRVRVMVKTPGKRVPQERYGVFRGNDMLVPLAKDEVYEIWVENRTGQMVLMRLLVDGLNTLPELVTTKGVAVYETAARVDLDEARHWNLDPQQARLYAIRGFVTKTGAAGRLREFKVVDAQDSVAARQKFTDQLGLITAAFYAPKSGQRSVGTGFGEERPEEIARGEKTEADNLLAVVHIRYVEPTVLAEMFR